MNKLEEREHARDLGERKPWPARLTRSRGSATALGTAPRLVDAMVSSRPAPDEQLAALRRERDALQRGLFEAAQVQRRFSARRQLRRGQFDMAGEIFPARHVSGDFLTAFDAGSETVLSVGDIAGKGLSAGMWFTHMVGLIRIFAGSVEGPGAVATAINRHLAELQPDAPITTLFLTRIDPRTGELTYCNAGHPAPLVLRGDGSVEWLSAGGPVLGAVPDAAFAHGAAVLNPGDTLLSYSDGILECSNPSGQEFGLDRLVDATRSAVAPSATAMLFSVLGAVQDFAAGEPRVDDVALLVVHRLAETYLGLRRAEC